MIHSEVVMPTTLLRILNTTATLILSEFCHRGSTGFGVCYRRLIDLALPIDSDRLQVRSLGWSDSSFGSRSLGMLATIDCTFRRIGLRPSGFHSCVWGTAVSLPSRWDRTEQNRHCFFLLLLYDSFVPYFALDAAKSMAIFAGSSFQ